MTRWIALAVLVLVLGVALVLGVQLLPLTSPNANGEAGEWLCIDGSGGALPDGPMWVPVEAHPSAYDPYGPCTDDVLDAIANLRGGVRPTLPAGVPQ